MAYNRNRIACSQQLKILLLVFFVFTAPEILNLVSGRSLSVFGILPRSTDHLQGVLFAPFLHGSPTHYASNIVPLIVLSFFAMQHGILRYVLVTCAVIMCSGLLVWLFARPALHIGASGLIYGYFGFLLVAGFVSREFKLILISVIVWLLYGGLVHGVLPTLPHISFESHLAGFLVGAFAGYRWGGVRQKL